MKNLKGFTLIELLVVIAIIGLLSTMATVSLNNARKKARVARYLADITAIRKAAALYYDDNESMPPQDHDWDATCENATFVSGNFTVYKPSTWNGPYIGAWPLNPWGGVYHWEALMYSRANHSIAVNGIPQDEAQMIDDEADNGVLTTGDIIYVNGRVDYYVSELYYDQSSGFGTGNCS